MGWDSAPSFLTDSFPRDRDRVLPETLMLESPSDAELDAESLYGWWFEGDDTVWIFRT